MKPQDYINRNLQGYEGDENIHLEIQALVKKHKIKTIIETGTYLGGTTARLATLVDKVVTIESDPVNQKKAYFERLNKLPNVHSILAHSQDCLGQVIALNQSPFLLFLDAHWEKACPLLDELNLIAEAKIKPVILIHDFYVPDRPELGFDSYNGQRFDFDWIKDSLQMIYGKSYTYHYNDKADGAMRGVIYIEPTKVNNQ